MAGYASFIGDEVATKGAAFYPARVLCASCMWRSPILSGIQATTAQLLRAKSRIMRLSPIRTQG